MARVWVPVVLSLALVGVVLAVFWSAWEPFREDLSDKTSPMVVLTVLIGLVVLVPPVAWSIAAL